MNYCGLQCNVDLQCVYLHNGKKVHNTSLQHFEFLRPCCGFINKYNMHDYALVFVLQQAICHLQKQIVLEGRTRNKPRLLLQMLPYRQQWIHNYTQTFPQLHFIRTHDKCSHECEGTSHYSRLGDKKHYDTGHLCQRSRVA